MSLTWSITGEKYCCNHFSHKLSSIVNLFSSTEKCQWTQIITEPQLWTTCFSLALLHSVVTRSRLKLQFVVHLIFIFLWSVPDGAIPRLTFYFCFEVLRLRLLKLQLSPLCRKWSATTAYSAVCRWLTCLNTLFALHHHRTKVCVKPVSEKTFCGLI